MVRIRKKKCCHCKELFLPDPRHAKRQKFCNKPACRRASKSASQRKWLQKPENVGYFKGPENVQRVQQWRKDHPGYWRPKPKNGADALQDFLIAQTTVLFRLIANFTGSALQDDIASTVRRLQQLGQDILNPSPCSKGGRHDNQIPHPARTAPKGAEAVQLARSSAVS